MLLSYFNEEMTRDCGNCDVCRSAPVRFDGTTVVQKALSAVLRTDCRVGAYMLRDILRGAQRHDIRSRGFDRIRTFGAGADLSAAEWNYYISQMIQLGLLDVAYDDGNRLHPTPFGMRVVRGEERVMLAQYTEERQRGRDKSRPAAATAPASSTEALLARLKAVRRAEAARIKMPPYLIFSDASLKDMAMKRPRTLEEFREVSGAGEVKTARFGPLFLSAIAEFA